MCVAVVGGPRASFKFGGFEDEGGVGQATNGVKVHVEGRFSSARRWGIALAVGQSAFDGGSWS